MSWQNVTSECGCIIEIYVSHDWESGRTTAEDVNILTPCKTHAPQAKTIERLAEFIQSYMDNFQKCPYCFEGQYNDDDCRNCHGTGQIIISVEKLYVELPADARALLAEVRGAE